MKGVLLSRCPDARLVDITHELPPFSLHVAHYALSQAVPYFPPGTIHLVVVDPGVGTSRRALLVEWMEQLFVAPDNGVLTTFFDGGTSTTVREITRTDLFLPSPSSTFHGRDIFAPVAGSLASGKVRPQEIGPLVDNAVRLPNLVPEKLDVHRWRGTVLSVDHFGNVITNFPAAEFPRLGSQRFDLKVGSNAVSHFYATFGSAPPGVCFAYFGSSGFVEIGQKQRSAAAVLTVSPGDALTLTVP
jgi:hypothetical protein